MWQSEGLFQFYVTFTLESYRNDFEIWRFYKGRSGDWSMCFVDFCYQEFPMIAIYRLRWDLKVKEFLFLEAGNEYTCHTVINSLSAAILYTEPG